MTTVTRNRLSQVPWSKRGAPRSVAKPSWMGMPPARFSVPPPSSDATAASILVDERIVDELREEIRVEEKDASEDEGAVRPIFFSLVPAASETPPSTKAFVSSVRESELEAENAALRAEVARLATHLATVKQRVFLESETEIVRLAFAIGSRIAGHEAEVDPLIVLDWIKDGIAALPRKGPITIAVASNVAETIPLEQMALMGNVVVDPSLQPGTCELREGPRTVHVGVAARADAISDALLGDRK